MVRLLLGIAVGAGIILIPKAIALIKRLPLIKAGIGFIKRVMGG